MKAAAVDLLAGALADVEALEGARCAGSAVEFIDVTPLHAHHVIRSHCHRCVVVGRCREMGDALSPHDVLSVYGARRYDPGEPADGWEVDP